jgi:hypothetical protein
MLRSSDVRPTEGEVAKMEQGDYQRIRVLVETDERSFRGYLYKPHVDERHRLSDYLNEYTRPFLCLADVQINDRGEMHRPGDKREFVALSVSHIRFIAPMAEGER